MKTFREIAKMHYASEPTSTIDKIYKKNRIDALEKLLTKQLNIPVVVQQSELLIGLLTMLEKEGGNDFINKAEIVAMYQANL